MEPIKQEIINNIFENGDKLITGPILQTVLIDMIDDVNVKDQEILSKTGSWDDAATQIPNLATKEEVTNLSESVARDLENVDSAGYATETWVESQGYLKEHQDISGLATKAELTEAENNLQGNLTSLSESVARDIANVDVDLTGYATETWVQDQGYLKEHQDISGLATKVEVTNLSESVARDLANVPEGVATEAWVQSQDYASKTYVDNAVSSSSVDLTGYATETWVESQGYLKEHQDISNLATKSELTSVSESIQTDITNLSESVANSAVWKKGTGEDSLVQKLTGGNEANTPTATGIGAVAIGTATTASGNNSHAEGQTTVASGLASHAEGYNTIASAHCSHAEGGDTKASGSYSHAEGIYTEALGQASHTEGYRTTASKEGSHAEGESTIASGSYSHAEGGYTTTSNQYEHAQGQYNHNSTNQIFSVGAGEKIGETVTRRNAVSILEVPNADTQVVTASVFIQNVGGYDGTNPEPGTNDLATVINNLPSGGSSETLWKKGTGQDSVVQKLTGAIEASTPTATGAGSVAIGYATTSSGYFSHAEGDTSNAPGYGSHAEGYGTTALGSYSHAEGDHTKASGTCGHAEGLGTTTSNNYEHAQGRYNHNSANQIFSIGTGNSDTDRRNVVSVLEVKNNDSYIGSFFIQNIGGYDGTNPTPGTNDLATVINNLSSSVGSSSGGSSGGGSSETLWKKGTGTDSLVQVWTGDNEAKTPTATVMGAVAIGYATTASGAVSHAEGMMVVASGPGSHAEGGDTKAEGSYSHAEGSYTIASNNYEHAQGTYNHSSENQIFSIGAGEIRRDPDTQAIIETRRNAISVLAIPNSGTEILTSSVFIQNVGGYDGTNPTPGTNDLATVINGVSSIWKKGEGQDSIVQVLTGDFKIGTPSATGIGAIATGVGTRASGMASHAEGYVTTASKDFSHAEGSSTTASGEASHAEGYNTVASNDYEHAQGRCNHSSRNQIFSVGAGETINEAVNRRNAISVLSVPNSETLINTASVFVQNIGGYDGTNPTPGTNDLATVLNNTETWTFTLEDGSTVTKNIRIS